MFIYLFLFFLRYSANPEASLKGVQSCRSLRESIGGGLAILQTPLVSKSFKTDTVEGVVGVTSLDVSHKACRNKNTPPGCEIAVASKRPKSVPGGANCSACDFTRPLSQKAFALSTEKLIKI
jgi:hypothetical protein